MHWLRRRQRLLLGLAVFAIAFAYVQWIAGDRFNLGVDEGIYLEGGRRVAAGQSPYRDFFVLTGPLTFWSEGALVRVGGVNIPLLRLPLILDVAFLAWAVYWLGAQFAGAPFSAGMAAVFLAFVSKLNLLTVKHRWDSAALATAAVLAALAAERRGSRAGWLLAGAFAAAAAWATPSMVVVGVPLLLWAGRRNLSAVLAFLCGGGLVSAAAAGYLAHCHALGPMIEAMRWTAANYTRANWVSYGALALPFGASAPASLIQHAGRIAAAAYEALPAVLPIAAMAGWSLRLYRRREDPGQARAIVLLLGVTAALVASAWPRWSSSQLLFVSAVPFALCGILLDRLLSGRRPVFYAAFLLLAAISIFQKSAAAFDLSGFSTRAGYLRGDPEDAEFLEPLEHRIQPGDSLFVFPYLPALYVLLDARNPTRFLYLQPGMMTAADERAAIADLEASPPRWVVMAPIPSETILTFWPGSDPARIPMEAIHLYLRAHYRKVEPVNGKWGAMEILERSDAPR